MQTQYDVNQALAIAGMPHGAKRESVDLTLAALPQIDTITIADASAAAGETWTIQATNTRTNQVFALAFLSGVDLPTTLDNAVAALAGDGKLNDLFSYAEDGATVLTATSRIASESYTWATTPGGSATAVVATTQAAIGADVPLGIMIADGTEYLDGRVLDGADAVANLAGVLFRTDANNFQEYDEPVSAVAGIKRGRTMSIMEEGRVWVEIEDAAARGGDVFVRRSGSGVLGAFRATADGGDTIDVSAFCKWERGAVAGGLALLRIRKQG